jgi:hypothetical protein
LEVPNALLDMGLFQGYGLCSDNSCPCPETKIPSGEGYLYIAKECVEFRKDALSAVQCEFKLQNKGKIRV